LQNVINMQAAVTKGGSRGMSNNCAGELKSNYLVRN